MPDSVRTRTGRPRGSPPNRRRILAAAREQFIRRGYDAATIRGVATAAGVDPALVYHYFASKDQLLLATLKDMGHVEEGLPDLLAGGVGGLGERVIRATFEAYETTYRPMWGAVIGLLRASMAHEAAAEQLRAGLGGGGLVRLVEALNQPQPQLRAALVASVLWGVAIARLVIRLEPIASADIESIVVWYAPTIQGYLAEALPGDPSNVPSGGASARGTAPVRPGARVSTRGRSRRLS